MANVRRALRPASSRLNLAVFFAGATHKGVADAGLIGSLAPFPSSPPARSSTRRFPPQSIMPRGRA